MSSVAPVVHYPTNKSLLVKISVGVPTIIHWIEIYLMVKKVCHGKRYHKRRISQVKIGFRLDWCFLDLTGANTGLFGRWITLSTG